MIYLEPMVLYKCLQCLVYFLIGSIWIMIIYELSAIKFYTMEYVDASFQRKLTTSTTKSIQTGNQSIETILNGNDFEPFQLRNDIVRQVTCIDKTYQSVNKLRGNYWVLYNYVKGRHIVQPHATITYTTHSDYTYLDNIVPLLDRWKGPISIALFAPGEDFEPTLQTIHYLRDCTTDHIKEFVTFHIYFNIDHVPETIPKSEKLFTERFDCNKQPPYLTEEADSTYKARMDLTYPVNVGRNIARESAQTHFVLASDIELYPSPELIPKFLDMIASNATLTSTKPKVFVLNIFEVDSKHRVPMSKKELKKMIFKKTAIPFHMYMCVKCHKFPKIRQWIVAKDSKRLGIFHVAKRRGKYQYWEPIFIGTKSDPFYDERLSWEGKSDKMTQGYILCVLDYDYMMLDNAFLVHKPGIKKFKLDYTRFKDWNKTNDLLENVIREEYKTIYGEKDGCAL